MTEVTDTDPNRNPNHNTNPNPSHKPFQSSTGHTQICTKHVD